MIKKLLFKLLIKPNKFRVTSFLKKQHFEYIYRLKKFLENGEEGNPVDEAVQHR